MLKKLTNKEIENFHYIIQGYSSKEIAKKLHRSSRTVEVHEKNIKSKLNCLKKRDLIKLAFNLEILTIKDKRKYEEYFKQDHHALNASIFLLQKKWSSKLIE